MPSEVIKGGIPLTHEVAEALGRGGFLTDTRYLERARYAYAQIPEIWDRRYLSDGQYVHITQLPNPRAGNWGPNSRAYTEIEAIALGRRRALYDDHFSKEARVNNPLQDNCYKLATALWGRWGMRVRGGVYQRINPPLDPFEIAVGNLLSSATEWMRYQALVQQGEFLQDILEGSSKRTLGEILLGLAKGGLLGLALNILGKSNPLSWPLTLVKLGIKPIDQMYKKLTGKYPIYGEPLSNDSAYSGWQNVSADDRDFQDAYQAFAAYYNDTFTGKALDRSGRQIILPVGRGKATDLFMKTLAEAIYVCQPSFMFCQENRVAATMQYCNGVLLADMLRQGLIRPKHAPTERKN